MKITEGIGCQCGHSRGYHKWNNTAHIFTSNRPCTYPGCGCLRIKLPDLECSCGHKSIDHPLRRGVLGSWPDYHDKCISKDCECIQWEPIQIVVPIGIDNTIFGIQI